MLNLLSFMIIVPFTEFKRNGWPWKTWNGIAWIHYMQILFQKMCTKLPHNLWLVESVHGELWRQRANIKLYLDIQLHGGSTFLTPCVIQRPSVTCDLLFAFFHFQNTFDTSMMMHVSMFFLTSSHTVCVFLCQAYITKHNTHWIYPCCCK